MSDYIKKNSVSYQKNKKGKVKCEYYYTNVDSSSGRYSFYGNKVKVCKPCSIKQKIYCNCIITQSYDAATFGQNIKTCSPNACNVQLICNNDNYRFQRYVLHQQNLYALMRRFPERFPIISWVKNMNLRPGEQRAYSNLWYRQFGTSQALPANSDWGGFYVPGSEVPYTN